MNPTFVAILMIALVIGSLFVKRVPMQYALYIVPVFCALLLGYNFTEIGDMFIKQVNTAMQAAGYMCLFAMIYFNMLSQTGMFNTLVKGLLRFTRGRMNIFIVMAMTSVIAAIGMLTATVVTAYLIVFPIMLPFYKKMNFDRSAAMIIAQTSIAAMCFLPWGIAVVNSSMYAGVNAMELSQRLIPVALCFIPVIILQWVYFGFQHKRSGGLMTIEWTDDEAAEVSVDGKGKKEDFSRPKLFWFNLIVFIVVVALLSLNVMPAYLVFILASFITIIVDYQNPEEMFIKDSIEADIAYAMQVRGVEHWQEKTKALLERFRLTELAQRDGRLLSGGQMRRASLAIGVALNPGILLLDEPTANLDIATRREILRTLSDMKEITETVVIATHDMQLVCEWAQRIVVLCGGKVVADGTRDEIFGDAALAARVGIRPPEIFAMGRALDEQALCYTVPEFLRQFEGENAV